MKIIANLGYNWWDKSGGKNRAIELVKSAIDAGVNGVCVPCFKADQIYREQNVIDNSIKFQMPVEMLYDIKQQADNSNIDFYITPRYLDCIEYAKSIGVDKFHVQNGDILHKQLLKELSGEHILLSTGFATFPEIDEAANILLGDDEPNNSESGVILLHSTGKMPTPPSEAQFGRMLDIGSEFFPLRYGFESFFDYRGGKILDYMAMAFNPAIVMRRIDLADRKGLETAYSLNPAEMTELVDVAQSMVAVNNPLFYHEGFVEGDFDARIQHMRCPEGDYLLPSER